MKIRTGFVSNSSTSSFIIAANDKSQLKVNVTIEVDLTDYVKEVLTTEEKVIAFFRQRDEYKKEQEACLKAIGQGKEIFLGDLDSDGGDVERILCDQGIPEIVGVDIISDDR